MSALMSDRAKSPLSHLLVGSVATLLISAGPLYANTTTKQQLSMTTQSAMASASEAQLAGPVKVLVPYEATYQAEIKGMKVKMRRSLSVDDDRVSISMAAKKLIFAIDEHSESTVTEDGNLKSVSYTHKRRNLGDRKDRHAKFDWETNTVTDLLNDGQPALEISFPLYDKISYQEQFRLDLTANPTQESFKYRITDGRSIKDYVFKKVADEVITTPLGELNCVKFKRDRGENSDRETYIWFAKDWGFLLARLDQIEGKDAKPERLELRDARIGVAEVTGNE